MYVVCLGGELETALTQSAVPEFIRITSASQLRTEGTGGDS